MKPAHYRFFALAGILVAGCRLDGAVFPRISAEELTAQSQVIVQGNVVRSWAAWDSEHKYSWTHFEVSVSDALRGPRTATVTVSEPGGSLDGIHQQFSGIVPYSDGESLVLFLYKTPIGYWRSVGGPQGKFTVAADGRVRANLQAGAYVDRAGKAAPGTPLGLLDGLRVADFKNQVRRLAAAYPARQQ
jgi:hypothetical protein